MNKVFTTLGLFIFLLVNANAQEEYNIRVNIDGLKDTTIYMSYYYGAGQYYRDTTKVNHKGEMIFSKKDTLEKGMYSIILGGTKLFDFIVDNQSFTLSTDTSNYVREMKVKGSPENEVFFDYLAFLNERQKQARKLNNKLLETEDEKAKSEINDVLDRLDKEVKNYIEQLHNNHPKSLTSSFIKALDYPEIPDSIKNSKDSSLTFKYFKKHFFDNINFSDGRLVRTAAYHEKLMYFLDKLTSQEADSIIAAVDLILDKAEKSPAIFKYTLNFLTSHYERSQRMGMDAVFVHLAKKYYMKGKADDWFSEKQLNKLRQRALTLEPLLIGKRAPNIVVMDTAMKKYIQLENIEAKYTVVFIWSPECGHCKVATPKLKKLYDKYKDQGLEVFGVGNEFENEEWIKFINKHNLDWINGSDGGNFRSNFRDLYDVYSTPQTYLLDENKVILAKKMTVESLEKILEHYLEKDKKKSEK